MKKTFILFISMLFLFSLISFSMTDFIILYSDGGYPPFYWFDENDELKGMFVDFLEEFNKEHPEYNFVNRPASRIRMDRDMESGDADAFSLNNPMFVDPDVVDNYIFSQSIWYTGDFVFMYKDNVFDYTKPEDLYGKTIGIMHGNAYGEFDVLFEEGKINSHGVTRENSLFMLARVGRIDAFFGNMHVTPFNMLLYNFNPDDYVLSEKPIFEFDLMMWVQSYHEEFVEKMDSFIQKSKENGLLEEITNKYIGG